MGNITTIKSRKKLDYKQITADLHEINKRRFGGLLDIRETANSTAWVISYGGQIGYTLYKSQQYKGRLTHKHGRHWWTWVDVVVTNELALKYNASISDEGVPGSWKGEPNKYPTVRSWFEMLAYDLLSEQGASTKAALKQMLEMDLSLVPEPIRSVGDASQEEG